MASYRRQERLFTERESFIEKSLYVVVKNSHIHRVTVYPRRQRVYSHRQRVHLPQKRVHEIDNGRCIIISHRKKYIEMDKGVYVSYL